MSNSFISEENIILNCNIFHRHKLMLLLYVIHCCFSGKKWSDLMHPPQIQIFNVTVSFLDIILDYVLILNALLITHSSTYDIEI